MSYLIFKGVSTASLSNVAVSVMPSHKRGAMRYTEFYVKGRDGALHIDEGLSNFETQATLVLLDAAASTRQAVNAWASGTGKLITSDDTSKAYKASVKREIQWGRIRGNTGFFDTAKITFDCDPYMYEATETESVFTQTGTITNPGTVKSIPLITVEGSGDATFTVGYETVIIKDMVTGVPVILDCENGYVYSEEYGSMQMIGNFPEIPTGTSNVILEENVTKITIAPHWRWI